MENEAVRHYWQQNPCAAKLSQAPQLTPRFFADIAEAKDNLEPHRNEFAGFAHCDGLDVLEIGIGLGVDFVRFVEAGARGTGIDLTQAGVDATIRQLEIKGLSGDVRMIDAGLLPFADDSFDWVYSWGVLHHAANTEDAVAEIARVLRPGGNVRVMLYARRSWFAVAVWGRQMVRERRLLGLREAVSRGLESPGTKAYTASEAHRLFSPHFARVQVSQVATAYDRRVAGPLAVAPLGWHLLIRAS